MMPRFVEQATPEEFETVGMVREDDWLVFADESIVPGGPWSRLRVELVTQDEGEQFKRAAMPYCGSDGLVLRDEAIERIGPLLAPWGELLPFTCDEARLVYFRPAYHIDCLDHERSDIVRFPSTGRIMDVQHWAFREERIGNAPVFKVAEVPTLGTFYRSDFVAMIMATGDTSGTIWKEPA